MGMEVLSILIQRVTNGGYILDYVIKGMREVDISPISIFVNDTIVFYEASND